MKFIKFFMPRIEYILFAALFWSISANGPKLLNFDGDLPRHLLLGRLIRETKSVPLTDTFSFRTVGLPSVPHEWLSQVLLSISHDLLGLSGVVLLTALIVTIVWAIVFYETKRRSYSLLISLLITAPGIAASMIHVLPRPHLFTYLFTAIWIVILERIVENKLRHWWLLPFLMVFWVNLHGMFILGIVILGIYLFGNLLDNPSREWFSNPSTKSMLLGGLFSVLATFLSPTGFHIWAAIAELGSNSYITSRIPEYQSANFHMPETWPFIILFVLTMIGFARDAKRTPWTHILLAGAFAAVALYTSRMIPLFAIVAVPITAQALSDMVRQEAPNGRFESIEKNISTINSSSNGFIWVVLVILMVTWIFRSGGTIDPQNKGNQFDENFFPVQAVSWLNSHPQNGHMFNEFDWGGYLLLKLSPRQQIFMDGHTHIYGEALTREYERAITLGNDWQDIFQKYDIRWVILRPQESLARELINEGWDAVYKDQTSIVLVK